MTLGRLALFTLKYTVLGKPAGAVQASLPPCTTPEKVPQQYTQYGLRYGDAVSPLTKERQEYAGPRL